MAVDTPIDITGGLPYSRRVRVKDAAITWPSLDDFEVRSEIRVSPTRGATLKGSLTEYIVSSIDGDDIVLDLVLTGSATRTLTGGYYDIVISDPGTTDHRGIQVLKGKITVEPLVTGG